MGCSSVCLIIIRTANLTCVFSWIAVGYQAVTADGKTEQPNAVLEALIAVVRPTGGLGIPGLYVPKDPGAPDSNSAKGYITFPFGKLFEKGLTVGTGQCNVKVRIISPGQCWHSAQG